jgi:hypothetical protein
MFCWISAGRMLSPGRDVARFGGPPSRAGTTATPASEAVKSVQEG